jgi:hypothetical protein
MPLTYEISRLPRFIRFEVAGDASLADMHGLIDSIAQATLASHDKRVLVNLLAVRETMRFTDHYAIGELVARRLSHLQRVASVVPSQRRTGTSEKVANAQGIRLRVFVDEAQATAWLAED